MDWFTLFFCSYITPCFPSTELAILYSHCFIISFPILPFGLVRAVCLAHLISSALFVTHRKSGVNGERMPKLPDGWEHFKAINKLLFVTARRHSNICYTYERRNQWMKDFSRSFALPFLHPFLDPPLSKCASVICCVGSHWSYTYMEQVMAYTV